MIVSRKRSCCKRLIVQTDCHWYICTKHTHTHTHTHDMYSIMTGHFIIMLNKFFAFRTCELHMLCLDTIQYTQTFLSIFVFVLCYWVLSLLLVQGWATNELKILIHKMFLICPFVIWQDKSEPSCLKSVWKNDNKKCSFWVRHLIRDCPNSSKQWSQLR